MKDRGGMAGIQDIKGKPRSYWIATTTERPERNELRGVADADVTVIGAGIAGITTAFLLARSGAVVVLLDADRVAHGVSGQTTGKVTSGHGFIYGHLRTTFGPERARLYGEAGQSAIDLIEGLVKTEEIDCQFKRVPLFLLAGHRAATNEIEGEAELAGGLGLPVSVERAGGSLGDRLALKYADQARFHPRRYLMALLDSFERLGGRVFEDSRAVGLEEGRSYQVITPHGRVTSDYVVVATHFPFIDPAFYFARIYQKRSYCYAARTSGKPDDILVNSADNGSGTDSFRLQEDGKHMVGITGDGTHKTGQAADTVERYLDLEKRTAHAHNLDSFDYRWSTQDCYTMDRLPMVGELKAGRNRVLVATGFQGWGMTNGTVSGMILSDAILGRTNPWADVFNHHHRLSWHAARRFIVENANVSGWLARGHIKRALARSRWKDLRAGEARIVSVDGTKVAAYHGLDGVHHCVSPFCTHLGCLVTWNAAEESWDCPCHGSRFAKDGSVLHGPAALGLKQWSP